MKKIVSLLFGACMCLFVGIMLVACGNGNNKCEHTYEIRVNLSATCAREGESEEVCSKCGTRKPNSKQAIPKSETHTSIGEFCSDDSKYHIKSCYDCNTVLERSEHSFNEIECSVCKLRILEYTEVQDGAGYAVSGVNISGLENITVPTTYNDLPIVEIGFQAFYQSKIKSIKLPDGLRTIGEEAFMGSNITEIVIPASVTEISNNAFDGCSGLRTVDFASGSGLTTLGNSTFRDCVTLEKINLPAGVTRIEADTFYRCKELSVVNFPDSLTYVGERAFEGSGIRHLYLPDSLIEIGSCAFVDLPLITVRLGTQLQIMPSDSFSNGRLFPMIEICNDSSLDIPWFVVNIYSSASGQSVLRDHNGWITFEGDLGSGTAYTYLVEYIGEEKDIIVPSSYVLWEKAFYNNDGIVSVILRDEARYYSTLTDLFWGCNDLKKIVLPEYFTIGSNGESRTIDSGMFGNCHSLESVNIPYGYSTGAANYESFENPFFNAPTTCTVKYSGSESEWAKTFGYTYGASVETDKGYQYTLSDDESYYIVSGIGTITDMAKLYFPRMHKGLPIREIGNEAFKDLYGELVIEEVYIHDGINVIGEEAFCRNKLTALYWESRSGDSYVIKSHAFSSCDYLSTVELNGGSFELGDGAFTFCSSLQYFDAGYSTMEIGIATFSYCKELIAFSGTPRGAIGHDAFAGCSKLESIDLRYVVSLGYDAFRDCTTLTTVTIPASLIILEDNLFKGCSSLLHVNFEENSQLTTIKGGVFSGCARLTELDIPESVIEIGTAFYGCSSLTKINLPKGATSIGGYNGCTALETITIPFGVTKIDAGAFEDCTSLETVIIEHNSVLNLIEGAAFNNCSSLAKIYFGGTKGAWDSIMATTSMQNNAPLATVTVYFYSESEPTTDGNYWHYNTDGKTPVLW